jgi:hypothetical protein
MFSDRRLPFIKVAIVGTARTMTIFLLDSLMEIRLWQGLAFAVLKI